MRLLLWLLGLFALAVAVALLLTFNSGYALLVRPPYRVELSLNLLLFLLVAGFAVAYLVLRGVFIALSLPEKVRQFRTQRRREEARAALTDALRAFFEARYGRAEKAAVTAMELGDAPALGAVLAARAAHELRHYPQRDGYLARAEKLAPDDVALRIIAEAEIMLDERRYQDALTALKALPEKHTAGLRLELKAQQQAKNWEAALQLIDQLERRGAFESAYAGQLRRHALAENLQRKSTDRRMLEDYWQKMESRHKRDPKIAAAGARYFIALGDDVRAYQIIEQALETEWDSDLAGLYGVGRGGETMRRIERAENWLRSNPRDAVLLLTLGRLCAQQALWGKAQSYFEASLSLEATHSAHLGLAELNERLGNADTAHRHYRASLDLAIAQLNEITGGRRKTPV